MRFLLLGPVDFRPAGRSVRVGARRERLILGALALQAGRAVPLARLAAVVWPGEEPPDNARQSIKVSVSRLRTVLSPYGITILKRGDAYVLQADPADTDAGAFRIAVAAAGALADAQASSVALRAALALWRGDVLEDVAGPEAQRAIASDLVEQRLIALRRCLEIDIAQGRFEAAVAELRGLVATGRTHEPFVCLLMTALVDSGRPAEALDVYADLRRALADDLGVDPTADTTQLYMQILRQQPGGEQLSAERPGEPESGQPLAVQTLPRDVPLFTGRSDELATVSRHLSGTGPLVVITGTGGIGKTALAVHLAHRSTARFPDGQLFVNLRGYGAGRPPSSVDALTQLLVALGEPLTAIPPGVDNAASLFRARLAGRRMLLVVDNAASADQVRPLLPGSSSCGVVVTSRDPLNGLIAVDGAERVSLRQLSEQQSLIILAGVLGGERVRVEADAATRLAVACRGLPLALRVAAANLAGHPDRSIASYCDEMSGGSVLDALQVDGDLTMGVRATLASSYESLSVPAQRLFRLLGVPASADFTVDACAALVDSSPAAVAALADELSVAHLIDPLPEGRYGMHDLVRAYAAEVGEAAEVTPARERLLGYYLHSANNAAGAAYPGRRYLGDEDVPEGLPVHRFDDRLTALAWLDTEVSGLVAEAKQAAERMPYAFAWKICDALAGYFWLKRHAALWLGTIEAAEQAAEAAGDAQRALEVLNRRGIMHWGYGEYDRAERVFVEVVAESRRLGDLRRAAGALSNLSGIARDLNRLRDAKAYVEESLAISAQLGEANDIGGIYVSLAFLASDLGEFAESLAYAQRAVDMFRSHNHVDGIAAGQMLVAQAISDLDGSHTEAYAALAEARATYEAVGAPAGLTAMWGIYSNLARVEGRPAEALASAHRSVVFAEESGQAGQMVSARLALARAYRMTGDIAEAEAEFQTVERMAREVGINADLADALIGLATIALERGDRSTALQYASAVKGVTERQFTLDEAHDLLASIDAADGR